MELNIVGDVAGNFKTLIELLNKMPKCKTVLVGDIIDRGPRSKQVLDWVMEGVEQGGVVCLMGNHEHMMVDFVLCEDPLEACYENYIWLMNGGGATLKSFFPSTKSTEVTRGVMYQALKPYAEWAAKLPMTYEQEGLFVSHAPWNPDLLRPFDRLWNRARPRSMGASTFQVHGHNAREKVLLYKTEPWPHEEPAPVWGANIDTSQAKILTGMHWPSKEIFQQRYID